MDLFKWKCKNWIVYFKRFDKFYLTHLIVKKLDVFNFNSIFCYCYHTHELDLNTFLKNIHQNWEYYREEKQDFERLLILLNIKLSAKLNKIELG